MYRKNVNDTLYTILLWLPMVVFFSESLSINFLSAYCFEESGGVTAIDF
jgi:hypothetical protein